MIIACTQMVLISICKLGEFQILVYPRVEHKSLSTKLQQNVHNSGANIKLKLFLSGIELFRRSIFHLLLISL